MKNQLTLLLMGSLMAANVGLLAPAKAEAGVNFYCGQSRDPLSRRDIPTTLIAVPGRQEPFALIRWKSEYFSGFAPQERCRIVSPKFQAAYQTGRLNFLATGEHPKTGQGFVCGLANEQEACEETKMLFMLKPYSNPTLVLRQIIGILMGAGQDRVIYQSSGGREIVDLRNILPVRK